MACYLCAYQSGRQPRLVKPLPAGSPAEPHWPLGVCARCSVAACSQHGARYGRFECAICEPASATEQATIGPAADQQLATPALAVAHAIGERASGAQRERARHALDEILAAAERTRERGEGARLLVAEGLEDGEPNLVGNLAGEIRRRMGVERGDPREFVAQARVEVEEAGAGERAEWEGYGGERVEWEGADLGEQVGVMPLDAIGAGVAAIFADRELRIDDASVTALTGALLMAMATADMRYGALGPLAHPEQVESIEVKPPWTVTHPVLLDPVMWMVATAYTS